MSEITDDERRWIASLHRLAKRRPGSLGLWGGTGNLLVVALGENGEFMHGVHDDTIITVADVAIPAGGGDPQFASVEDVARPWIDAEADTGSGR
jgi:hypothetical protein